MEPMMEALEIGLAGSPATLAAWSDLMSAEGYHVVATPLFTPPPAQSPRLWIAILDDHMQPGRVALWLRALATTVVLVTPHLKAAQALTRWVPGLVLICPAPAMRASLEDLITMSTSVNAGIATIAPPAAPLYRGSRPC
jgi:hypothetical protein